MSRLSALKLLVPLLAVLLLGLIYLQTGVTITLQVDGEQRVVRARAATVGAALRDASVTLDPEDTVQPPPDTPLAPYLLITVERAPVVQVEVNGQTRLVRTRQPSPPVILAQIDINPDPGDVIWVDGVRFDPFLPARTAPPRRIEVRSVVMVSVSDGGAPVSIQTAARTVGEALWEAGYHLYLADEVAPPFTAPITPVLAITINRSHPVTVQADGQVLRTRTYRTLVGDVLSDLGLALVGEDYAVPPADQPLPADGNLRVVRVREARLVEQEVLPFETVYQGLPEVEIDSPLKLVQPGASGVKQRRMRVRYEDGQEVSRAVENEGVVQTPVNRVLGYGTKIVVRTLNTADGPIEYWRAYAMYATSYAAKYLGGSNITASGMKLTKGIVAIDRRYVSFYAKMYVPGYGFAVAGDTGGGVKGRWIDLGFDDWNYEGWHQKVTVYFLTPIPSPDKIVWVIPQTVP